MEFEEIVEQVAKAVSVILKWAAERGTRYNFKAASVGCNLHYKPLNLVLFNCIFRKVVIGGHSAGSHLCAMLLHNSKSSWAQNEPNIHLIRGMVHISGVFDLTPLVNTYVNDPLKLNEYYTDYLTLFSLEIDLNHLLFMQRIGSTVQSTASD